MNQPTPTTIEELDTLISEPSAGVLETVRQHSGSLAVLGAGGKMGYHLCLMLQHSLEIVGRSERVLAVSRFGSDEVRRKFEAAGCRTIAADLSDPEQVVSLPDIDHLFFLAGVKFGTAHDPALLEKMNVTMPALVADRFRNSQIVALSTGCVYSFTSPESGGSTEESETNPPGEYANSCKGREQAFFAAAEEFGTESALIRLNYAIDLRYGVLVDLGQKVLVGEPVDLTTGYVNVIWQGDALSHTVQSLNHVAAPPFVLNVTGPHVLSVRNLALKFGEQFEREVTFTGSEQPLAWLNNAGKSHRLFGPPTVDIDQMVTWVADWLQENRPLLGKPTHFQNRDGNY